MEEEQFFDNHSEDADENQEEENPEVEYEAYQQNQNEEENQENEEAEAEAEEEVEKAPDENVEEKIVIQKEKNPLRINKTEEITTTTVTKTLKTKKKLTPKETTVTKVIKGKTEFLKPQTNIEEHTKNVIYSNKNFQVNPKTEDKNIDNVEQKNHQFYSSYFSKKNKNPQSQNSYSKYSSRIIRKSSASSVDNLRNPVQKNLKSFNTSYTSQNYIPSSQTTKVRHTKLTNGCVRCPNCNFIFNPNENYSYESRSYFIENKPEKNYTETSNYSYRSRKNEIKNIPFDTYGNKNTIQTTIETKTNYNPNIYTNERGTTVFTQPKRKVQVIRKSFGANGEVFEEEIKDRGENSNIGSRFSYGNKNVENNNGYYESYGSRENRNQKGYRYAEYY